MGTNLVPAPSLLQAPSSTLHARSTLHAPRSKLQAPKAPSSKQHKTQNNHDDNQRQSLALKPYLGLGVNQIRRESYLETTINDDDEHSPPISCVPQEMQADKTSRR
eukprot:scaffold38654_cov194-Skeletonema_dohrnii-CCMP3373.AAC.1